MQDAPAAPRTPAAAHSHTPGRRGPRGPAKRARLRHRFAALVAVTAALLLASLLGPTASAAVPESSLRSEYDFRLAILQRTQNYDGGWGEPLFLDAGNNTTVSATEFTRESLNETVLSVLALQAAGVNPVGHWTNYNDKRQVSLAASDVPNTLDWLRDFEVGNGTTLTAGEQAMVAAAYDALGDRANALRISDRLIASYRDTGGWGDLVSIGKALWSIERLQVQGNETVNETVTSAASHLVVAKPAELTLEEIAWGYMALNAWNLAEAEDFRQGLGSRWDPIAGYASLTRTGLAAWTLAQDPREYGAALEAVEYLYERGRDGLGREGRAYYVLADSILHPQFSARPVATGSADSSVPVGGLGDRNPFVSKDEYERLLAENEALRGEVDDLEGRALPFPMPAWLLGAILLSAVAVLVIVKLAWGLKKEDLAGARKEIFGYIEGNPGEHLNKIRRELGMAPGTIMYHLNNLETEGWITSHKDSRYKRYYVNGNKLTQILPGGDYKQKFAILANDTSKQIAKFVREHPGSTQKAVSTRLDLHPSTVNWHAKRLKQAGLLTDQRVGKEVRYELADERFLQKYLEEKGGEGPGAAS